MAGLAESRSIGNGNGGYPELQAAVFDIESWDVEAACSSCPPAASLPSALAFKVPTELVNHVCQDFIHLHGSTYHFGLVGIGVDWGAAATAVGGTYPSRLYLLASPTAASTWQ